MSSILLKNNSLFFKSLHSTGLLSYTVYKVSVIFTLIAVYDFPKTIIYSFLVKIK
jgi:hypothetical protein